MGMNPRFADGALEKNLTLVDRLQELAASKNASLGQLALAWVLAKGDDIVPIPGTKKVSRLEENIGAIDVFLSPEDLEAIEKAVPPEAVAGARYPETTSSTLNA